MKKIKKKKNNFTYYATVVGHSESNKEQQPLLDRTRVLTRRSYRLLFAKIPT